VTRLNPAEDAALARALKQREHVAMAQLYDCYGSIVYRRIYSLVQNSAIAEELAQEVFLRVWTRAKSFDETRGSLCSWVLTVARNRALDYLRSKENHLNRRASSIEQNPVLQSLLTCENRAAHYDVFGRLRAAFTRLSFNQRTVLELSFEEGLSHSEVAARLQRPLGTVKTQIRLAIKFLRAEMLECR
jgi:RNA polymerase sigma-70 factor (ECF subfamily)